MTGLDLCGFIAYFFVLGGMFLIAKKHRMGWLVKLIGDLGWVGISFFLNPIMYSIMFVEFAFSLIDIYGYANSIDQEELNKAIRSVIKR